ncbi:MAG: FAD-dependent oxidoreductase [Thermodesulfobacteriota bacterium]|nr:FAD-dependent oxidoreductase [Thermodesulfobacteriota bacterium]
MNNQETGKASNRVLVVGGGVGGIKTAMDLAEAGRDVILIDKAPSIGGLMTQLDRTFPTNNCDLCTLSPNLAESSRQLHIELLALTRLVSVEGEAGRFKVGLKSDPRFIDLDKCTACGDCLESFPECVRFMPGLDHRAPTCMRYPQATPEAFSIDIDSCTDIEGLVKICQAEAVLPQDSEKIRDVEVGAIVVATGGELFDAEALANYGYGKFPDVVTGLEYERILSASGPTKGDLVRPSDGTQPKKIGWIQCSGSRNINQSDVPYCSSVCCMYALKEAIVTKERFHDDMETVIYYMDMRTFGKDYEQYYERARNDFGIRFVRSRPHTVDMNPETDELSISFITDEKNIIETEQFDMIVLSTGFRVPEETIELAGKLGIDLDEYHFAKTDGFSPVSTSRPGIYVCGVIESPKDIPETIVQASAAACLASKDLSSSKENLSKDIEFPPEEDVRDEAPRIGVFVCDCGENVGGVIDVPDLVEYAQSLPQVAVSENVGHGCSRESLEHIQEMITQNDLNRVVIGGCSPRTHESLFQDAIRKAGLNRYLLEMANIRDQDTWVHKNYPEMAISKSKDLIRMAVASVALAHPLTDHNLPMNKDVLVVGGGVAGMTAALSLADQGFRIFLAERSSELGGVAKEIHKNIEGGDVQAHIRGLIDRTTNHDLIQVLTNSIIVDHTGMSGMFKTGLQIGPRMFYRQITHGVTILATGAMPNRPNEYLLDKHEAVVTQLDLDGILESQKEKVKGWENIVMIQCVGSRTPENPNCSRICCQTAVKNALRILDLNPQARIYVLYRDMRTYGLQEDYYRMARERGVAFVRYQVEKKPLVKESGDHVTITFYEPVLEREITVSADCLALSTGLVADDEGTEDLSAIFKVPRTSDGYFLEDHIKLRPVDLSVPGFFVAGTAHAPKGIGESIAQAQAAAGRALTLLAKDTINLGASVARVDSNKCAACLICVRACPFDVPFINADGYSEIDPSKCHGCGVCVADCPAKAIQLMQYEDDQIMAKVDGLLEAIL